MTEDILTLAHTIERLPGIGTADPDKARLAQAVIDLTAKMNSCDQSRWYPHMCRDEHPQIGHRTDEERCPVCIERDRRAAAERELREQSVELETRRGCYRSEETWRARCATAERARDEALAELAHWTARR